MRALMVLLLCFVVAFQGSAIARVINLPHAGHEAPGAMASMAMSAGSHDCCNDADTVARTGKLCKSDMPCGSVCAAVLPVIGLSLRFPPLSGSVAPGSRTLHASWDPAGVWRPPTLG